VRVRRVNHGFGAVAVGVEQKAAVVVVAVLRARPGRAVVAVTGVDSGPPEVVDLVPRCGAEADVQPGRDRMLDVRGRQREVVPLGELGAAVAKVAGGAGLLDPDRAEHGLVEALGRAAVAHPDRHVVEHQPLNRSIST
jgi:hypothetical protein